MPPEPPEPLEPPEGIVLLNKEVASPHGVTLLQSPRIREIVSSKKWLTGTGSGLSGVAKLNFFLNLSCCSPPVILPTGVGGLETLRDNKGVKRGSKEAGKRL